MSAVSADRRRRRAAALSVLSNSTLIVLKLAAGLITGSVAIITEAVHSAMDLVASVVAWFSVGRAARPADADHSYGHGKLENAAAAIEAMLILVGSAVIFHEAVTRLGGDHRLEHLPVAVAVLAVSLVANLVISRHLYKVGRETDSPALEGDAAHLSADALTSGGVLAGLTLAWVTGWAWLDAAVALAVAAVIVVTGVRLLTRASRVLLDEALPEQEQQIIHRVVCSFSGQGVVGYHALRSRRAGAHRYADLHVQFADGTTLADAHDISHRIQDQVSAQLPRTDLLIHLEPADRVRVQAWGAPS